MAERITVFAEELRQIAAQHDATAERLGAEPDGHAEVMATLDSLGPVFAAAREAGQAVLAQRRACYEQQAALNADLAEKLRRAADAWESNDADAAGRLQTVPW